MFNLSHPSIAGQEEAEPPALSWSDADVARAWLLGLRVALADIKSVTEDQQLPLRQRRLGPVEAQRITRESFTTLELALSFAERGLPPPPFKL